MLPSYLIKKIINSRYIIITIILVPSQEFFSCWGIYDSQMGPNQKNRRDNQPVQSHRHVQQSLKSRISGLDHYPGNLFFIAFYKHFSKLVLYSLLIVWPFWRLSLNTMFLHPQTWGHQLPCIWNYLCLLWSRWGKMFPLYRLSLYL